MAGFFWHVPVSLGGDHHRVARPLAAPRRLRVGPIYRLPDSTQSCPEPIRQREPRLGVCSKCPGNGANRRLLSSPSPAAARPRPPTASPLLADDNPSSSIKHYFLTGLCCQAHLQHLVSPSVRLRSQISGPWCVGRKPPTIKNCRPASSALSWGILALGRRLRPPPLPSCKCLQACGACWMEPFLLSQAP